MVSVPPGWPTAANRNTLTLAARVTTGNGQIHERRLLAVAERLRAAEAAAGRPSGSVHLLAVSKGQPAGAIDALATLGQRRFGESYLQEALEKRNQVTARGLEWHFVGPVQSNKTRGIAEHFDWVQSADRDKVLRRLDEQRPEALPPLQVCLQVNISGEAQKAGASPEALSRLAEMASGCRRLRLRGLMAIPAPTDDEGELRRAFAALRGLYEGLRAAGHELDTLSMGMSADLEPAVAEGSTMVRVGTALFGPRE